MRKMIKITIAVFCAGVLLSGIGTGVAIAEYTSLEYTGHHILGEENIKEEFLDIAVTPVEGKKLLVDGYYWTADVVYDESVPVNTIRYKTAYDPSMVKMRPWYQEEQYDDSEPEEEQRYQGYVHLESSHYRGEFDTYMKNKDLILGDLKQGKIGSYESVSVDYVEIWMNPQMKDFVEINW